MTHSCYTAGETEVIQVCLTLSCYGASLICLQERHRTVTVHSAEGTGVLVSVARAHVKAVEIHGGV